jgi:hypothetical protein
MANACVRVFRPGRWLSRIWRLLRPSRRSNRGVSRVSLVSYKAHLEDCARLTEQTQTGIPSRVGRKGTMTTLLGAVLLIVSMLALMKLFGLFSRAVETVKISKNALQVISNPNLEDDRKESLLQEHSRLLLRAFSDLFIRSLGSIGIPAAILWCFEYSGIISFMTVLNVVHSWPVLLIAGTIAAFWLLEK